MSALAVAVAPADNETRIAYYLNEGWRSGPKPYDLLAVGECVFRTGLSPNGAQHADIYRQVVLHRARERYRAGFYADPFTSKPRRRPGGA